MSWICSTNNLATPTGGNSLAIIESSHLCISFHSSVEGWIEITWKIWNSVCLFLSRTTLCKWDRRDHLWCLCVCVKERCCQREDCALKWSWSINFYIPMDEKIEQHRESISHYFILIPFPSPPSSIIHNRLGILSHVSQCIYILKDMANVCKDIGENLCSSSVPRLAVWITLRFRNPVARLNQVCLRTKWGVL